MRYIFIEEVGIGMGKWLYICIINSFRKYE